MALDERDFVTSALAGLVVICATMLVEKCGGVIGGTVRRWRRARAGGIVGVGGK